MRCLPLFLSILAACGGDAGSDSAAEPLQCEEVQPQYASCVRSSVAEVPGGWVYTRGTVEFDANGWVISDVVVDGEGTLLTDASQVHDDRGRVLSGRWDDDGDGRADKIADYDWDGCTLVGARYDFDDDGVVDQTRTATYDEQGRTLEVVAAGADPFRETWSYDGSTQTRTLDWGDDGTVDEVLTEVFEGEVRVLLENDENHDGVVDFAVRDTLEDGHWVERRIETGPDYTGSEEARHEVRTHAEGRTVDLWVDRGPDGTVDLEYRYSYDELDRLTRVKVDIDPTGDFGTDQRFVFDYTCP